MENKKLEKPPVAGCAILLVVGVLAALGIISLFKSCGTDESEPSKVIVPEKITHSKVDAWSESKQFVKSRLKSPSSAEFDIQEA